ncbi:hypothetical protein ACFLIM_46710 [Nonomuraea sp. M3C6]|uniref:Zinc transporter, ZIP family n=1 Tax=Nonomuraea marmarensis TaxID=3351344 RepID=A0ABW7ATI0_9ACTN
MADASATSLIPVPAQAIAPYLGFFGGFLLYLATAEILPEAHTTSHPTRLTLLSTVCGALLMWLVTGLTE